MKLFARFLSILAIATATLSPRAASAQFQEGDYWYDVVNGEAVITGYEGPGGDIVIPATLGSHTVTRIGWEAFAYCTTLTSVAIPDSVTSIVNYAFMYCTALTSVIFGNSVALIGDGAFYNCVGLLSVSIPESVTFIGIAAFEGCTALKNVTIGNSVTTIGPSAFSGCTSLESVTLGDSVESIVDLAFYNCTSLASVIIPDSVTSIGRYAFGACSSLSKIIIPESVTDFGMGVFAFCTSLTDVFFCGAPPTPEGVIFEESHVTLYYLPAYAAQWPSTYTGLPTVLWNPTFTAPELVAGAFSSSVTGTPNIPVAVEARASLLAGEWVPLLSTNIPTSGTLEFTDPDAADHSTRLYRIICP